MINNNNLNNLYKIYNKINFNNLNYLYKIFSKRDGEGLGGGSRRYSTKRRSLRKSRTVKNMK